MVSIVLWRGQGNRALAKHLRAAIRSEGNEGRGLFAALAAIARYVDLKSPYTLGHSSGVAELATRDLDLLPVPRVLRTGEPEPAPELGQEAGMFIATARPLYLPERWSILDKAKFYFCFVNSWVLIASQNSS